MGPLPPNTLFAGDYRIVQPLSAGGMGTLYVVEQVSTRKLRALKLMHRELVADESFRRRFEQEARIGARIPSEHVVEVQAAGVDAQTGAPYLVMELLEGENLGTLVARRGALGPAEVRVILEQVCHAVGAAHQAGIVHRDLKPDNVFLARARRTDVTFTVKVLDFGIAKLLSERTIRTAALGSPLWLAPEQTERSQVTAAADVWALGLIAYFLLTGSSFWRTATLQDASITQVMREVLFDPIPSASVRAAERGQRLPDGFDAWFAWCVQRDPAARPPDAAHAFAALAQILPGQAVLPALGASPAMGSYPSPTGFGSGQVTGSVWGTDPSGSLGLATGADPRSLELSSAPSGSVPSRSVSRAGPTPRVQGMAIGCLVAAVVLPVLALGFGAGVYWLLRRASPGVTSAAAESAQPAESSSSDSAPLAVASVIAPVPLRTPRPVSAERARSINVSAGPAANPTVAVPTAKATTASAPTSPQSARPGRRGRASTLVNGFDLPADCQSVLRGLEPRFRDCYERVINRDDQPHDRESMILDFYVAPAGTVSRIETHIDNAPPGVGTCSLNLLRTARFSPPPKGSEAKANLILSFAIVQ
jgi:serine/threonine protein kinase